MTKPRVRIRNPYFVGAKWPRPAGMQLTGIPENHPNPDLNGIRIFTSRVIDVTHDTAETQNTVYELVKYESQDCYESRISALKTLPGPIGFRFPLEVRRESSR